MISLQDENYIQPGMVALVGGGPGDPDLLTVAALKAIGSAEVVVYDALISQEILALIPERVERVFAGKRGGSPSVKQADICDTLISLARKNLRVLRLKGGDPFLFGRGGEEACRLSQEGIPFRVVPGLSAGTAGPAYAGIPVTHREINANVAFLTGHEQAQNPPFKEGREDHSRINWKAVGSAFPVLVIFMAMSNLGVITQRLREAGRAPETPIAIIRWATTPRQETLVTTLENALDDVKRCGMGSPSIIVVGDVVNYRQKLAWFKDKNLTPE